MAQNVAAIGDPQLDCEECCFCFEAEAGGASRLGRPRVQWVSWWECVEVNSTVDAKDTVLNNAQSITKICAVGETRAVVEVLDSHWVVKSLWDYHLWEGVRLRRSDEVDGIRNSDLVVCVLLIPSLAGSTPIKDDVALVVTDGDRHLEATLFAIVAAEHEPEQLMYCYAKHSFDPGFNGLGWSVVTPVRAYGDPCTGISSVFARVLVSACMVACTGQCIQSVPHCVTTEVPPAVGSPIKDAVLVSWCEFVVVVEHFAFESRIGISTEVSECLP